MNGFAQKLVLTDKGKRHLGTNYCPDTWRNDVVQKAKGFAKGFATLYVFKVVQIKLVVVFVVVDILLTILKHV